MLLHKSSKEHIKRACSISYVIVESDGAERHQRGSDVIGNEAIHPGTLNLKGRRRHGDEAVRSREHHRGADDLEPKARQGTLRQVTVNEARRYRETRWAQIGGNAG
jgi:hypothetical protein